MKKATLVHLICSLLILLFAYTAISKLLDHARFQDMLRHSPLLTPIAGPLSFLLPAGELGLCGLLAVPRLQQRGLWGSVFFLSGFTAYLIYMLAAYTKLPCACGGVIGQLSWPQHVVFNLLFLVLSLAAVHQKRSDGTAPFFKETIP